MNRVNMSDKYLVLVQHGQGFVHVSDSTNSRDVAFRIVSNRAKAMHKLYKRNVVPTYYIMERIAFQKVEAAPKIEKKKKSKKEKDFDAASDLTLGAVR